MGIDGGVSRSIVFTGRHCGWRKNASFVGIKTLIGTTCVRYESLSDDLVWNGTAEGPV